MWGGLKAGVSAAKKLMNLLIEVEREDDGRWIAEVPELPGVIVYDLFVWSRV
jgi:hypothetical protein